MERIVTSIMRFVAGRQDTGGDLHVNRIAMGGSQDRALAAFKADQARIAGRQDGATFATKRSSSK